MDQTASAQSDDAVNLFTYLPGNPYEDGALTAEKAREFCPSSAPLLAARMHGADPSISHSNEEEERAEKDAGCGHSSSGEEPCSGTGTGTRRDPHWERRLKSMFESDNTDVPAHLVEFYRVLMEAEKVKLHMCEPMHINTEDFLAQIKKKIDGYAAKKQDFDELRKSLGMKKDKLGE